MGIESYNSIIIELIDIENEIKAAGSCYGNRNLSQSILICEKTMSRIEHLEKHCPPHLKDLLREKHPDFELSAFFDANKKTLFFYLGISYVQSGQFQKAIKILSASLSKGEQKNHYTYYHDLTQFIEVAQKIPLPNEVISKAHTDVNSFLNKNGKTHWKHELLLMKSRYELLRGNYENAYYLAKEAIACALMTQAIDDRYGGQVWDFHYDGLISLCLALDKIAEAKSYITQWANSENQMPVNRLMRMNKCLSDIARFEGNGYEAEKYALIALKYADDTDYQETQFSCLYSLCNAFIENNQHEKIKEYHENIQKLSSSERLFIKYHMCLIEYKLSYYENSDSNETAELKSQLFEYGERLNQLLYVDYYNEGLLEKNKIIVY